VLLHSACSLCSLYALLAWGYVQPTPILGAGAAIRAIQTKARGARLFVFCGKASGKHMRKITHPAGWGPQVESKSVTNGRN